MRRPGVRLRAFAARVCSDRTMARLIDPAIADLQSEHGDAVRAGRVWKSRWVLLTGYIAFSKVFTLCGLAGSRQALRNWSPEDQRGLSRTFLHCMLATAGATVLFGLPEFLRLPERAAIRDGDPALMLLYLLPSTLALSVPAGLAIGTTIGVSGRGGSRRFVAAILLTALMASGASFANVAWLTPVANQNYREEALGHPIRRALNELTLTELQRSLHGPLYRSVSFAYHSRLALAAAPLTFAAFALVIATRRRLTRTAAVALTSIASVIFVIGLIVGGDYSRDGLVPTPFGAWLPQGVLVIATIYLGTLASSNPAPISRTRA